MPAGVNNPVVGYFAFCAIKFGGYALAGRLLSDNYRHTSLIPFAVGGVRTLIGMAAGAGYYFLLRFLAADPGVPLILAGLVPIRFVEWWLLIWLFYDRHLKDPAKGWRCAAFGTFWSYILDLPAIFGFVLTGGLWIC
ncbi:MAG TPA: hypothetical protein VGE41_09535 [Verrucomicrobiae bacterium]|jgi:hypothetical protein